MNTARKKLIIDANLLLLLVIGAVDERAHIKNSKRLNGLTEDHYQDVLTVMGMADEVAITPYIATEVSNLIDLNGEAKDKAFEIARRLFSEFKQINSEIQTDTQGDTFLFFGLTDNSLIGLVDEYLIFTNDKRLSVPLFAKNPQNVLLLSMVDEFVARRLG